MELNSFIRKDLPKNPNNSSLLRLEKPLKFIGLLLVGIYRTVGTQLMGGNCKFLPSCSEYACEAIHTHSPFLALKLVLVRLFKCRPFSDGGYDPVPERRS